MELAQESASWSATIDSGSRVMESGVDADEDASVSGVILEKALIAMSRPSYRSAPALPSSRVLVPVILSRP